MSMCKQSVSTHVTVAVALVPHACTNGAANTHAAALAQMGVRTCV